MTKLDSIKEVLDDLIKTRKAGGNYENFKKLMQFKELNVSPMVYWQNVRSAQSAGRWQTLQKMKSLTPWLMYDAVMDINTRPIHAELNGKVFHIDDPFWNDFYPPNGFGCRCGVSALDEDDIKDMGLSISKGTEIKLKPNEGFNNNPGKDFSWMQKWSEEKKRSLEKYFGGLDKKNIVEQTLNAKKIKEEDIEGA